MGATDAGIGHLPVDTRIDETVDCPVAHGEGNFLLADETQLGVLKAAGQVALIYAGADQQPAG